jgi:hypothetical protein
MIQILTQTIGFHTRGCVHCVAKQTVARHLVTNNARHTGPCNMQHALIYVELFRPRVLKLFICLPPNETLQFKCNTNNFCV